MRYNLSMTSRTIALCRFLLTIALASLVLALLPLALTAHENATAVSGTEVCLPLPAQQSLGPPRWRRTSPRRRLLTWPVDARSLR